jgi:hypothetical protein
MRDTVLQPIHSGDPSNRYRLSPRAANQQIQFVRRTFEQRQINNRQGVLQVWDMMLAFSEDPKFKKLWDEVMENGENEAEE